MIDGAFTGRFDQVGHLLLGRAWPATFTAGTAVVCRRRIGAARPLTGPAMVAFGRAGVDR